MVHLGSFGMPWINALHALLRQGTHLGNRFPKWKPVYTLYTETKHNFFQSGEGFLILQGAEALE